MKHKEGDRIVVSENCTFEPSEVGDIVAEAKREAFDYVVRLDKYDGDLYEFREEEINEITSCNEHHKVVFSTERQRWICPFCE